MKCKMMLLFALACMAPLHVGAQEANDIEERIRKVTGDLRRFNEEYTKRNEAYTKQIDTLKTQLEANDKRVAQLQQDMTRAIPTGTVAAFTLTEPPPGWISCDGRELVITDHPALYAKIGSRFGPAAAGKFRVPNLANRFIRGWAPTVSRELGSYQSDAIQEHGHVFAGSTTPSDYANVTYRDQVWGWSQKNEIDTYSSDAVTLKQGSKLAVHWKQEGRDGNDISLSHWHHFTPRGDVKNVTSSARSSDETRPANVVLLFCIKD